MPNDLLPPNATPPERALSLATGREIAVPVRQLWSPQTCPAGILPWLAWALSVDDWDPAWPEQTQRNVIAASIEQHRVKGTIGALRSALQRIGYEVEIDEQTGAAYTFALRLKLNPGDSAGGAIAGAELNKAIEVALKTKNVRSELANTKFLGEGGVAPLYIGGAPIIGTEVEIGGAVDPLPLDGLETFMLGSFWTIRMSSTYTGPIARVRRLSDNAELSYSSLAELNAFVGVADWQFVGFYSQRGDGRYLRYEILDDAVDYPIRNRGGIDANGIPYARTYHGSGFANDLKCRISPTLMAGASFVMAAKTEPSSALEHGFYLATGSAQLSYFFAAYKDFLAFNANRAGVSPLGLLLSDSGAPVVFVGNADGATNTLTNGTSSDSAAWTANGNAETITLQITQELAPGTPVTPAPRFYGAALWNQALGLTDLASIRAAIATRLEF